jgi:hypothetical protein
MRQLSRVSEIAEVKLTRDLIDNIHVIFKIGSKLHVSNNNAIACTLLPHELARL